MKIKTNLRAGAKSGTAPKGRGADNGASDSSSSKPVVVVTRCAGL